MTVSLEPHVHTDFQKRLSYHFVPLIRTSLLRMLPVKAFMRRPQGITLSSRRRQTQADILLFMFLTSRHTCEVSLSDLWRVIPLGFRVLLPCMCSLRSVYIFFPRLLYSRKQMQALWRINLPKQNTYSFLHTSSA